LVSCCFSLLLWKDTAEKPLPDVDLLTKGFSVHRTGSEYLAVCGTLLQQHRMDKENNFYECKAFIRDVANIICCFLPLFHQVKCSHESGLPIVFLEPNFL
jgi:hypothetical protein